MQIIRRRKHHYDYAPSTLAALVAFGLGTVAMYFFDPVSGRQRRSQVREQLMHAGRVAGDAASGTVQNLRNRAYDVAAEAKDIVRRRTGMGGNGNGDAAWPNPPSTPSS